ncbi:MAG TPA: hypothetical protein VJ599_09950 [Nitrososphaeraceae archaeon]|nr:hypothetical protein [Nitrososphaeraceae archaeon]
MTDNFRRAILTRTETDWLSGRVKVSEPYEYRIKGDIRKKIKTFTDLELPLILNKKMIDNFDLSKYNQNLMINYQVNVSNSSENTPKLEFQDQNMVGRKGWIWNFRRA